MIDIIGKYNYAKVFTDLIENSAYSQIQELCNQEAYFNSKIRIMPDVHAGAGCTIGTTMTIQDAVCPNLVGVDIGCGITSVNLGKEVLSIVKDLGASLDEVISHRVPAGQNVWQCNDDWFDKDFLSMLRNDVSEEILGKLNLERASKSVGTLGGGNHFIEVGKDSQGNFWLTVHSGSRNIGKQIAEVFQEKALHSCQDMKVPKSLKYLTENDYKDEYLRAMRLMQEYASHNREIMLKNIVYSLLSLVHFENLEKIETVHNYIDFSETNHLILRKGAVSSKKGELLMIPMNMRDGIILAKGKGNEDWNFSAPHGAGRLYSRGEAKRKLSLEEFKNSMQDVYSTCVSESTLDEAPMAYKGMEDIVRYIGDTVEILDVIKPVYNFKA